MYNLPETVKEGDIEKLGFALELARVFAGSAGGATGRVGAGGFEAAAAAACSPSNDDDDDDLGRWDASQLRAFLPDSLLWLIQRDFLEGSTVTDMVDQALRGVANPTKDAHVAELNRIRASLRALAANHDAFGLTQPHLERTRLCELRDDQLEPGYVEQREKLKAHVRASAVAKPSIGAALASGFETASNERFRETPDARRRESAELAMTGVELAALIERSVAALNEGDFPTAGSVVDGSIATPWSAALRRTSARSTRGAAGGGGGVARRARGRQRRRLFVAPSGSGATPSRERSRRSWTRCSISRASATRSPAARRATRRVGVRRDAGEDVNMRLPSLRSSTRRRTARARARSRRAASGRVWTPRARA